MDVHVHSNPRLHYGHNGYHQAPHSKDDGLQFLSVEEKECILFFEETIGSLEDGLEDDGTGLSTGRSSLAGDLQTTSSPAVSSAPATANMTEYDIIDLVRSTPDIPLPDFQRVVVPPQSHFEIKPKRDAAENVSGMAKSSSASEESGYYPPPGSIPTPVVIASKIAEHQSTSGTTALPSVLLQRKGSLESSHSPPTRHGPPTQVKPHRLPENINMMLGSRDPSPQAIATAAVNMQERRSQMLANLPPSAHPLERGEPACVRNPPSRSVSFTDPALDKSRMEALSKLGLTQGRPVSVNMVPGPGNKTEISMANRVGSGTDTAYNSAHIYNNIVNSASISPNTTVSLKNSSLYKVTSTEIDSNSSHIYNNTANNANISPNATVSQKNSSTYKVSSSSDLASNTSHVYNSTANNANISPTSTVGQKIGSTYKVSPNNTAAQRKNSNTSVGPSSPSSYEAKSESYKSNFNNYGGKSSVFTRASKDTSTNHDKRPVTAPAPISAEVTRTDFNSYGGKSITLNPTPSFKAESIPSTSSPPTKAEPADIQNNSYGGRSTVINPSTQADFPACRPRSHSHSPSSTITASTLHSDLPSPTEGKSRIFPPVKAEGQHTGPHYSSTVRDEAHLDLNSHDFKPKTVTDPVFNPAGRSRPATMPPVTAPRPQRPSGSLRPRLESVPTEIRSKLPSKTFRTQGITVQFSGKGGTDEARRDALRKLGLLKDTS